MHLTIPDYRCPSWNSIWSSPHWTKRKDLADQIHQMVRAAIDPDEVEIFNVPVAIAIIAQFKSKPIDADNIVAKPFVDGLKEWVITDDDLSYVESVMTITCLGPVNTVEIFVKPAGLFEPWCNYGAKGRWRELIISSR